jgi:hypothetical protein
MEVSRIDVNTFYNPLFDQYTHLQWLDYYEMKTHHTQNLIQTQNPMVVVCPLDPQNYPNTFPIHTHINDIKKLIEDFEQTHAHFHHTHTHRMKT